MYGRLEINANINEPPKVQLSDATHISIGDLHGNTLKLIYILMEQGVLKLQGGDEDYLKLKTIYRKNVEDLTSKDISLFKQIIDKVEVNKDCAVTLIGDELCDRGQNDYFTLYLLNKLKKENAVVDILFSNHGLQFINDYETGQFTGRHGLYEDQFQNQGLSLTNMVKLMNKGLITNTEVKEMTQNTYMTLVKAIGYSVSDEGKLTLYTHAPVGLETIMELAKQLGLEKEYSEDSVNNLIRSINIINLKIQSMKTSDLKKAFSDRPSLTDGTKRHIPVKYPFYRLIWNRFVGTELVTKTKKGLDINFVHGHIGTQSLNQLNIKTHKNIDNDFGKFIRDYYDVKAHVIVRSKDKIPPVFAARTLKHLYTMLGTWERKKSELEKKYNNNPKNSKYKKAFEAADGLYDFLNTDITLFHEKCQTDTTALDTLKKSWLKILDPSNPQVQILKEHRGWKEIIANIVGFLISIPKRLITGTWFQLNTDSINKIEDIKTGLNTVQNESEAEPPTSSPKS